MSTRFAEYKDRIRALHQELCIPADYASQYGLGLQMECQFLEEAEQDAFGRDVLLEPATLRAWHAMREQAGRQGIRLMLVSGFRSVDYQCGIIRRKLDRGLSIADILQVNAAPGYSEHHTGQAIDLGTPGVEHLSEDFENSPAYTWLMQHGGRFGFHLSYPRDNPVGIAYEPWHWRYEPDY